MVKIVCWNIAKRHEPWGQLLQMRGVDIALLQEMNPDAIPKDVDVGPFKPWDTHPLWPLAGGRQIVRQRRGQVV